MKKSLLLLLLIATNVCSYAQVAVTPPSAENLQARKEYQDMKFGIFIHWGVYSMLGDGEWIMFQKNISREEYSHLPAGFYPSKFNADEWVKAIKDSGAKYVTITSRHHDGFSMFGTKASPYNIVDATPFHRDIIKELADACHKEGVKLHFYYSHMDWYRPDYPLGSTSLRFKPHHDESTTDWKSYYRFMNDQLTELLTNYGPIGAIWFDGYWDHPKGFDWQLPAQYNLIHRLQPACMVGDNHHQPLKDGEDFQLFEQDLPGEDTSGFSQGQTVERKVPQETCMTMNRSWGYNITDKDYKSADELIQTLVRAAGMNANFLLNVGPRPDGQFPKEAVERLKAIGAWMKQNGETIYGTRGGIVPAQDWGVTTQKGNKLYVHITRLNGTCLALPIDGNNVKSAVMFIGKTPVKTVKSKESLTLLLPTKPTGVDTIVELTLKKV